MKLLNLTEVQKDHVIAAFKGSKSSFHYLVGWFQFWLEESGFPGIQLGETERGPDRRSVAERTVKQVRRPGLEEYIAKHGQENPRVHFTQCVPTEGASLSAQLELPFEEDPDLAYHRRNEDKMLEARAQFEWEEDQRDYYRDEGGEG